MESDQNKWSICLADCPDLPYRHPAGFIGHVDEPDWVGKAVFLPEELKDKLPWVGSLRGCGSLRVKEIGPGRRLSATKRYAVELDLKEGVRPPDGGIRIALVQKDGQRKEVVLAVQDPHSTGSFNSVAPFKADLSADWRDLTLELNW